MALDQAQLDDLVRKINDEISKDSLATDPKRSFAQKVSNVLDGDKRPQKHLQPQQMALVASLKTEMATDPDFVSRLKATTGFPHLPAPSANVTSASASAASSPTTTPPPVTTTASASGSNVLTPHQQSLVDRFNSGIAHDHKARQTYDAFVSILRGGDDRVHKKALSLKLDIQAEQQRAQSAGETFPADAFIAAMAMPATPTPTVTTTTTAPATGSSTVTTTTVPPVPVTPTTTTPPVTATAGTTANPPSGPVPPAPPAAPQPSWHKEHPVAAIVLGILLIILLWEGGTRLFNHVTGLKPVIAGQAEQIEGLNVLLASCKQETEAAKRAKEIAEAALLAKSAEMANSDAGLLTAQLLLTRQELNASISAVNSWRKGFLTLKQTSEDEGRRAAENAQDCNAQILALRESLKDTQSEIVRLDTLSRQLQDPNNVGVPVDVDLLSFHLATDVRCEVRIKRWGEQRFQCFSLPGAGAGRIGTSEKIYRTTSGAHLYQVWCNGTKTFEKQVIFIPGERTKWARVCDRGDWVRVERTRPFLLLTGAGSEADGIDPTVNLSVRR